MLDASYITTCERDARRFSGAYTGTSGTLAAHVMRLLKERKELMATLEESNAALRQAVKDRLSATPADDPKMQGYVPPPLAGCGPAQACAAEILTKAWNSPPRVRLIGLAGHVNSGKSIAATMIPGAYHLQWADPIYRGLAAMLDVPEELLRDRTQKDSTLTVGQTEIMPRTLLQTLGTEWGRSLIHPDLWVRLTMARVERLADITGRTVFAICGTRFPNEVAAIRERGGEVWWIDRPGTTAGTHKSDTMIGSDACDRVIVNAGTPDDLRAAIRAAFAA